MALRAYVWDKRLHPKEAATALACTARLRPRKATASKALHVLNQEVLGLLYADTQPEQDAEIERDVEILRATWRYVSGHVDTARDTTEPADTGDTGDTDEAPVAAASAIPESLERSRSPSAASRRTHLSRAPVAAASAIPESLERSRSPSAASRRTHLSRALGTRSPVDVAYAEDAELDGSNEGDGTDEAERDGTGTMDESDGTAVAEERGGTEGDAAAADSESSQLTGSSTAEGMEAARTLEATLQGPAATTPKRPRPKVKGKVPPRARGAEVARQTRAQSMSEYLAFVAELTPQMRAEHA